MADGVSRRKYCYKERRHVCDYSAFKMPLAEEGEKKDGGLVWK